MITDKSLIQLRRQIIEENDGNKFSKLIKKLIRKYSTTARTYVLEILTEYSKSGQLTHWRNFLLPDIITLVHEMETSYVDFFEWCVTQPDLVYWGIDGLLKTKGKDCFSTLIELAKSERSETEIRAKSIKSLSIYSSQPFDRNLPTDPGYWEPKDLRIDELDAWRTNGYRSGPGYPSPKVHPSLLNPKTELQKIAAKLNKKLKRSRDEDQDRAQPSNWLVIAEESDIMNIEKKWKLPDTYLHFLKNFSPLNVFIDKKRYFQGLNLYGASDLVEKQQGYSVDPISSLTLQDWPTGFIVIADSGGDPYCLDLNQIKDNDAPVYSSMHGAGEWKFERYADSLLDFLKEIAGK